MPTYPHIERYHIELERLIAFGGSHSEEQIRPAFFNCLAAYCAEHSDRLALIAELRSDRANKPDGTVRDALRMARGYWEAKDIHDDLDAEIRAKLTRGYPRDNIIFEDSQTAVLVQNGGEAMRVAMSQPRDLHRLIRRFLDYELPAIAEFRQARQQFKTDLPAVLDNLRAAVAQAEAGNPGYQSAAAAFLDLCRRTISPRLSPGEVREMLLQHILTKDIFLRVFAEDQFHRENNIARQLDALEHTFFTGNVRRQAIDRLRAYYGAIGRAADAIADHAEKQQFLKAIYEDFYTAYNPAAADRLGVVYTPNEIVDFIIRGADHLLQKHFGRTLADDRVQILDPATGTGTFVTGLINYLPPERLEYKYRNEIHANEVAILPYYIANLNIEYTYKERAGHYLEFPNLCFVDTLDNMDWQPAGASGDVAPRQPAFSLGALSEENWLRVRQQNDKPISVIIGNPPYNESATLWGDNTANRAYPEIDRRISETYIAESMAQKTKQYDMYKRFLRWASDRLADDGIIAFVSNSAFLDARQDDGFRKTVAAEFNELWAFDLKGNARTSGERRRQEGGNIFSDKIRVGIAIYFLVRRQGAHGFKVYYNDVPPYAKALDKVNYIKDRNLDNYDFTAITPSPAGEWLHQPDGKFKELPPLANRETKLAKTADDEQTIFGLYAMGVNTARDEWVYDFGIRNLRDKALFFADTYNELLELEDASHPPIIKWSSALADRFRRRQPIVYNDANRIQSMYRPFVAKWHIADKAMNDRLTANHYEMFGADLRQPNRVINICANGRQFYALASDKLTDLHFTGDTQCLPLYRYTPDGRRASNITEWGLRQFREHYGDDGIAADDIFAYIYAMLHDPAYQQRWEIELLREFPRVHFQPDFAWWAQKGRELLDLHLGFEAIAPCPLERQDKPGVAPGRAILKLDANRNRIILDEQTTLAGVPVDAWWHQLGSRSPVEWVLEQYKERRPRDPTIRERFNAYRFADHKEQVIDLLQRVCAVSAATTRIVENELDQWTDIDPDEGLRLRPEALAEALRHTLIAKAAGRGALSDDEIADLQKTVKGYGLNPWTI